MSSYPAVNFENYPKGVNYWQYNGCIEICFFGTVDRQKNLKEKTRLPYSVVS